MAGRGGDDVCRLVRSAEIARVENAEALMHEAPGQGLSLAHALGRQGAVEVSLPPPFGVPCGFAVPDNDQTSSLHDDIGLLTPKPFYEAIVF